MALTLVQSGDTGFQSSGATSTMLPANVTVGNAVALFVWVNIYNALTSVTSPIGTFTRVAQVVAYPQQGEWWVCNSATAAGNTVTINASGIQYAAQATEWSGGVAASISGGNNSGSGTAVSQTVTPTTSGDVVLVGTSLNYSISTYPSSPWTNYNAGFFTSANGEAASWITTTSTSSVTANYVQSTSAAWNTVGVILSQTAITPPAGSVTSTFSASAVGTVSTTTYSGTGSVSASFAAAAYTNTTGITSLPILSVQIAFNPTDIQSLTQTWTDVTAYVRDLQTRLGRQHFLDRVEAGTLAINVSNRNGFFLNGSVNGTGYVIQPRLPVKVTATWNGTTYPIFFGMIDDIEERITDQLNSDLSIRATDLLKFLSLRYMASYNFWNQYAASASVTDWYRFTAPTSVICTSAVNASGTVTYQGINNFVVGQQVFVTGFGGTGTCNTSTGPGTVTSATSSQFVLSGIGGTSGASAGTGSAYLATIANSINPSNTGYAGYGNVAFPPNGAMVYSNDGCIDLSNGSNVASGVVVLPGISDFPNAGGIDFWVLGQDIAGKLLLSVRSSGVQLDLKVTAAGYLSVMTGSTVIAFIGPNPINDGYWHHVGLVNNSSNQLCLYLDNGVLPPLSGGIYDGINTVVGSVQPLVIGGSNAWLAGSAGATPTVPCLIDEVVISSRSTTLFVEIANRYVAGSLLSRGFPVTANGVLSGDRIAEILCIAGYGTISVGQIVLNPNTYFINNGSAWVNGVSTNGFVPVEPYYWDSPVTGSTALDLIRQICETDIGSFFQKPDGTFNFYNQNFYGTWNWPLNATSGTWTPSYTTPTGNHIWTDDNTSTYAYYGPSLQVLRDDVDTWTTVKVTPQSGTQQIYENVANEPRWGYSTLTKSGTLHTTLNLALSTANFLGNLFKSPLPRIGNVELRSETNNGGNMTALLNTKFGDVVTFKRTSPNASGAGVIPFSIVSSGSNTLSTSASTFNVISTAGASTVGGFYVTVSGTTYFASYTGITTTSFTGVTLASGSVVVAAGTTIFLNPNMVVESISHDFQADPGTWHTSFILDPYPIRS